jgi:hypothetical protein
MAGTDFLAVIESSPEMATALKDMCRKRLFKKAVKRHAMEQSHGLDDNDLIAAFHDADVDRTGLLNLDEVTTLMRRMDSTFPEDEIKALIKFMDIDDDGKISIDDFKRIFRQFEEVKEEEVYVHDEAA